jgi:hypothetical protein
VIPAAVSGWEDPGFYVWDVKYNKPSWEYIYLYINDEKQ